MASIKVRAFLVTLIVSLSVFGAAAMWLMPKVVRQPEPQPVTALWQAEDAVSLLLVRDDPDGFAACRLIFDPAAKAITATSIPAETVARQNGVEVRFCELAGRYAERTAAMRQTVPADKAAVLSAQTAADLLTALGNDLPLTLSQPVTVTDGGYLNLTADTHILTAEQVTLLLRHDPTLWAAAVASAVNTYGDPETLFRELVNHSVYTDLTVEDRLAAHDALVYLWGQNTGHLCRTGAVAGDYTGDGIDRRFYVQEN